MAGNRREGPPMNGSVEQAQFAWQPLTLRGVAAFARASLGRLLLVQLIVALVAAGAVVWFLHQAWFPTIGEAIRQLPPQGELRSGRLDWPGPTPARLAEGRFLALVVDLDHSRRGALPGACAGGVWPDRLPGLYAVRLRWQCAYPPRLGRWRFNRTELGPWWGAWAPAILAIVAMLVVTGLMVSWACLATVYFLPAWLVGFFANRDLSLRGSWRLAGAALMPGALLMTRRDRLIRVRRFGPRAAGSGGGRAFGGGLGLSICQSPVPAPASGRGGEGKSVRMIACWRAVRSSLGP